MEQERRPMVGIVVLVAALSAGAGFLLGQARGEAAAWDDAFDVAKNVYVKGACQGAIASSALLEEGLIKLSTLSESTLRVDKEAAVEEALRNIMLAVTETDSLANAMVDLWTFRSEDRVAFPNESDLREVVAHPGQEVGPGTSSYDVLYGFGCRSELEGPDSLPAEWEQAFDV